MPAIQFGSSWVAYLPRLYSVSWLWAIPPRTSVTRWPPRLHRSRRSQLFTEFLLHTSAASKATWKLLGLLCDVYRSWGITFQESGQVMIKSQILCLHKLYFHFCSAFVLCWHCYWTVELNIYSFTHIQFYAHSKPLVFSSIMILHTRKLRLRKFKSKPF